MPRAFAGGTRRAAAPGDGLRAPDTVIGNDIPPHALSKFESLCEAARHFASCTAEDDALSLTVEKADEILQLSRCVLCLFDGERFTVRAMSRALAGEAVNDALVDEALAGRTYLAGRTLIIGDSSESYEVQLARLTFRSGLCAPIGDLGVFQAVSAEPNAFTEVDERLLCLLLDLTRSTIKRIRLQKRLHEQGIRDPLTGVYNRCYVEHLLEHELARCRRYSRPVAFLLADINGFKDINDRFGHQAGDCALREVAAILQRQVRQSDTVIRYGGDEFLVVMPETDTGAGAAAERIQAALARRNAEQPAVGASIALAIGVDYWQPGDPRGVVELLNEVDERMYRAKRAWRSSYADPV